MHDKESGLMQGLNIAVVGIGAPQSVGAVLARDIVQRPEVMNSLDSLLLHSSNMPAVVNYKDRSLVESTPEEFRSLYNQKIRCGSIEEIAQSADIVFFCYDSSGLGSSHAGFPSWEDDARKTLYHYNKAPTIEYAKLFAEKKSKAQFVFVTNPTLDIARLFQETGGFEDGQVLAFNPDNYRSFLKLDEAKAGKSHIANSIPKTFFMGEHGSLSGLFYPPELVAFNDFNPAVFEDEVRAEGLKIINDFGSTSYNVSCHAVNFICSSFRQNDDKYVWGVPFSFEDKNLFFSAPFVNRVVEKDGRQVFRAQVCYDDVRDYAGTQKFKSLADSVSADQNAFLQGKYSVSHSYGVASFSDDSRDSCVLKAVNYQSGFCGDLIPCDGIVERIASSGKNAAVVTRGREITRKEKDRRGIERERMVRVPELIQFDFNAEQRREVRTLLPLGRTYPAIAMDGNTVYLSSHLRESGSDANVLLYQDGKPVRKLDLGVVSTAFGFTDKLIFFALNGDHICAYDKNALLFGEKKQNALQVLPKIALGDKVYFNRIDVLGDSAETVCASTHVPYDVAESNAYVFQKGALVIAGLPLSKNAFAAARVNNANMMFYGKKEGDKSFAVLHFIGEKEPCQKVEIGSEIKSLDFDSGRNYLYVGCADRVRVMPYCKWDLKLLDLPKKEFPPGNGLEHICKVRMSERL